MRQAYINFIRGIASNGLSKTGVILTTASFLSFCCLEILRMVGILTNAYIGLITYLVFPVLFVLGLLLIPYGLQRYARKKGKTFREVLTEHFESDDLSAGDYGSKLFRTVALLTLLNIVVLLVAAFSSMHFMDQASFCGTACHSVMNPEWVSYQQSPHAKVRCVECHVGEGLQATFDAKLNGAYQILSLTLGLYEKPIPTPVHNLRPARETCEKCHWPEKFHGNRLETRVRYALDSVSTPRYTTLSMKIGSGEEGRERGSHWHIAKKNEIRYASIDDKREKILWVDVRQDDGSYHRYRNKRMDAADETRKQSVRIMDCVDCHNRATHIYEQPDLALDKRIREGLIDLSLPYIKSEALATLTNNYSDIETGKRIIDTHLRNFYRQHYPDIAATHLHEIDEAVHIVQTVLERNIHPGMEITWGSYPNHIGHHRGMGCFRCHNSDMADEDGHQISHDCTLCHSILAHKETEPFKYLFQIEDTLKLDREHQYLQQEFLESFE